MINLLLQIDHRALLQMVYETVSITSTSIMPHLWIYRPQITIDHVSLSIEKETSTTDLRVLKDFLTRVSNHYFRIITVYYKR